MRSLSTEYHSVVCCTASRRVEGTEISENGYIQGAGDDSENWSRGLTPSIFWKHKEQLLRATEGDLIDIISRLLQTDTRLSTICHGAVKIGSTNLYLGNIPENVCTDSYDGIIVCTNENSPSIVQTTPASEAGSKDPMKYLHLPCGDGKLGSRALRSHLPRVPPFIASLPTSSHPPKILFASSAGKDLAVGVALTALCLFFDDECKSPISKRRGPSFPPLRRPLY